MAQPHVPETHIPELDNIEFGFLLPNGETLWGWWDLMGDSAHNMVTAEGRLNFPKLAYLREEYETFLRKQMGLTRAQIGNMPQLQIVTRTTKTYYTAVEEVH